MRRQRSFGGGAGGVSLDHGPAVPPGQPHQVALGPVEFGAVHVELVCPSDVNGDGVVDLADLELVTERWGPCSDCSLVCPSDINGDCAVDVTEFFEVINNWGPCN